MKRSIRWLSRNYPTRNRSPGSINFNERRDADRYPSGACFIGQTKRRPTTKLSTRSFVLLTLLRIALVRSCEPGLTLDGVSSFEWVLETYKCMLLRLWNLFYTPIDTKNPSGRSRIFPTKMEKRSKATLKPEPILLLESEMFSWIKVDRVAEPETAADGPWTTSWDMNRRTIHCRSFNLQIQSYNVGLTWRYVDSFELVHKCSRGCTYWMQLLDTVPSPSLHFAQITSVILWTFLEQRNLSELRFTKRILIYKE